MHTYKIWLLMCLIMAISSELTGQGQTNTIQVEISPHKIKEGGKEFYLHKVKKGQTLYSISRAYNVSQKELLEHNSSIKEGLQAQQIIKIPVISGRNSSEYDLEKSDDFIYHTIEKGQTIYYLTRKYNVTDSVIFKNNPQAGLTLSIGQVVKIPKSDTIEEIEVPKKRNEVVDPSPLMSVNKKDTAFIYHEVKPGETTYSIAKKYRVELSEIAKNNPGLRPDDMKIGSILRIPKQSLNQMDRRVNVVRKVDDITEEIVVEDDTYIYYTLKPGETLSSVSRAFKISTRNLLVANPGMNPDDLPIGYMVRIPKDEVRDKEDTPASDSKVERFLTYKVERRETLYGIAKKFNVSEDDIRKYNKIKRNRVRRNQEIRIPIFKPRVNTLFDERPEGEETLIAGGKDQKDYFDLFDRSECANYNYYQDKKSIRVALLLPFYLESNDTINYEFDEELDTLVLSEELTVDPRSEAFLRFYQGALIAINTLKKQGVNMEIYVHDSSIPFYELEDQLDSWEFKNLDLIIGPVTPDKIQIVAEFAQKNEIPLVSPLIKKRVNLQNNDYMFQVNPELTGLYDQLIAFTRDYSRGKNLIVFRSDDYMQNEEAQLIEKLRYEVFRENYSGSNTLLTSFRELSIDRHGIHELEILLSENKENVALIASNDVGNVNRVISYLDVVREKDNREITVIGFPAWQGYQINAEIYHRLNAYMITPTFVDYNKPDVIDFVSTYREKFKQDPLDKYPRFAFSGYDITYYFISAIREFGENFRYCIKDFNPDLLQSDFDFERVSFWGGFENHGAFFIHYNQDFEIQILNPVTGPSETRYGLKP